MADRKPRRWVFVRTRTPKPPETQDFAPVVFYLRKSDAVRRPENRVCAGRYYPQERQFRSLQGRDYRRRDVLAWQRMPEPPFGVRE